jgi:hypothetical protein
VWLCIAKLGLATALARRDYRLRVASCYFT